MTHPLPLSSVDLHDAVLETLAVEWSTGVCVMHLRGVGPGAGVPIRVQWHGLRGLEVTGEAPWGPSASVLDVAWGPDGADEIQLQSGDVIRVRAARRVVEAGAESLARRYGGLAADALADAGAIQRSDFDRVAEIIAGEIHVRRTLGDV
jgi:hypothetical protein